MKAERAAPLYVLLLYGRQVPRSSQVYGQLLRFITVIACTDDARLLQLQPGITQNFLVQR